MRHLLRFGSWNHRFQYEKWSLADEGWWEVLEHEEIEGVVVFEVEVGSPTPSPLPSHLLPDPAGVKSFFSTLPSMMYLLPPYRPKGNCGNCGKHHGWKPLGLCAKILLVPSKVISTGILLQVRKPNKTALMFHDKNISELWRYSI